jgi:hypothetical protein
MAGSNIEPACSQKLQHSLVDNLQCLCELALHNLAVPDDTDVAGPSAVVPLTCSVQTTQTWGNPEP